ncbi:MULTISPECIES: endonuclease dU [unclassified Microcoleus]|uniref:endonuclease dU n=1 Tax=unclassified Microcoleus TaxID=2642155 RepID=UPI002FD1DE53
MKLVDLLRLDRTIKVIGFDDAPFSRTSGSLVSIAGVVCGGTRFEGMVWGQVLPDGLDATDAISGLLLGGKFLPQLHLVLLDGIAFGGFNIIDLPELASRLQIPCVAVMRRQPDLAAVEKALGHLPDSEYRLELLRRAGKIYAFEPFFFQVCGEKPEVIALVLQRLTDTGKVPEALRLAHLIGAAVINGVSGSSA